MKVVAITNQKGGVGKTTTAVNLAAALGALGKKVLIIDLDAQRSASVWCGVRSEDYDTANLLDVIAGEAKLDELVQKTPHAGVDLVPASESLLGAESEMSKGVGAEFWLREQIGAMSDRWDFIFLDCPPELKKMTTSALIAANDVLITTRPGMLDLVGVSTLAKNIELARRRVNPNLEILGVLICQADARTNVFKQTTDLLDVHFPGKLFKTFIRPSVKFAECPSWAQSIINYAPKSPGALDYTAAANEFLQITGGAK